jgi:hypothetical protein
LSAPSAGDTEPTDRGLFFGLLVAVTLLPYVAILIHDRTPLDSPLLARALPIMLFLGAAGHVGSSFFYFGDARMRRFMLASSPTRYVWAPLAFVAVLGVAYWQLDTTGRAYFLVAFWLWQVHHFTRQNHGILSFASAAWRTPAHTRERLAITLTDVAAILATLSFMTPYRETALAAFGWHLHTIGLGAYACAWLVWLSSGPWWRVETTPGREAVVLSLMAFYAPLFVFADALTAVFMYLTAHGLQYLLFMTWVAKTPESGRWRAIGLLGVATVAGGLGVRALQNDALWAQYGVTLLGAAYGVTIWHFLLDGGVWRLRDAFPRAYMSERFGFLRR